MRGAVVIGALTFIGYHVVQKLLAEEVEVLAIDVDDLRHPSRINEEKLLLIGRNAGFTYHSLRDREAWEEICNFDVVYFCLCEPNQYEKLPDKRSIQSYLHTVLALCEARNKKLILLSSVNTATALFYEAKGVEVPLSNNGIFFYELEKEVRRSLTKYAILQVPTVYGPWQPTFMVYHQLILADAIGREIRIEIKENSEDAVYVEDVAECLYECGQNKVTGTYYIESGEAGQWHKGIALLNGSNKIRIREKRVEKKPTACYRYRPQYSLKEGLQEQILHVNKYKNLYRSLIK